MERYTGIFDDRKPRINYLVHLTADFWICAEFAKNVPTWKTWRFGTPWDIGHHNIHRLCDCARHQNIFSHREMKLSLYSVYCVAI